MKFCHYLLAFMSFQTHMVWFFFFFWWTKKEKNFEGFLCSTFDNNKL